jgi:hypothetical protein
MLSSTDGWAVGKGGTIIHYNGTSWSTAISPIGQDLKSVVMFSANDGWAVGKNGVILLWNGTSWAVAASPTSQEIRSVKAATPLDYWAVGKAGTILRLQITSGSLISSAYNTGATSIFNIIEWNQIIPSCSPACEIKFQIKTATTQGNLSSASWYGASGLGTYFTANTGTLIPTALNNNQWIQYRAELIGDGNNTPVLKGIQINYQ